MNNSISPARTTLLDPKLIHEEDLVSAGHLISDAVNPISACFSAGYTVNENFFPHLADVLSLTYLDTVNPPLSAASSIALCVPPQLLIENQIYAYETDGRLYCVVANPYHDERIWSEIMAYTGIPSITLVISNPQEIMSVLSYVFHLDLTITTSEMIHVIHKEKSTKTYTTEFVPEIFPIGFLFTLFCCLILFPQKTTFYSYMVLNSIYFLINPYKFYTFYRALRSRNTITVSPGALTLLDESILPIYTILLPLRNEVAMVQSIIDGIFAIDYPKDKLDIKFICDIDDRLTIDELEKFGIGVPSPHISRFSFTTQLIKVPSNGLHTKPRACNYALGFARGQYTVIYDAEDRPDPTQLKKAYIGFLQSPLDTACIQAKLDYYNSRQNTLTKCFTMEYGFWFDYYLPGLREIGSPIPLGGTSNHFITRTLRKIGTWDPYNVTEDADLGLRIFRYKYKTSIIDSYTAEEANSRLTNWIHQRTRWQKGFLITFLVHTAKPVQLIKELGFRKFILTILIFGGNFFLPLFNPILWLVFLSGYWPLNTILRVPDVPYAIYAISVFNLIVGNLTYICIHLYAAIRQKRYDLAPYSFFLPVYWMALSVATVRAAVQFIRHPYYWEKTIHGLSRHTEPIKPTMHRSS